MNKAVIVIPTSPSEIYALIPEIYANRYRLPLHNNEVSVDSARSHESAAKALKRAMYDVGKVLTKDQHAQTRDYFITLRGALKQEYGKELNKAARATWGRDFEIQDYRISGIACDEFSNKQKNRLRALAHTETKCANIAAAHSHLQRYTREATREPQEQCLSV